MQPVSLNMHEPSIPFDDHQQGDQHFRSTSALTKGVVSSVPEINSESAFIEGQGELFSRVHGLHSSRERVIESCKSYVERFFAHAD